MNRFRTSALAVLLGAAVGAPATLFVTPAARAADAVKEGEDTPLQKQMEVIDESMKKLRRTLRKADQNADSLATIAELKKAAVASRDLIPAMASTVPEAQRAQFVADYKKVMDEFIANVDKLEAAVKAGNNDQAVEIHTTLKDMEDPSHEKFTKS